MHFNVILYAKVHFCRPMIHFTYRDDLSTDPYWLMSCVTEEVSIYGNGFSMTFVSPASVVPDNYMVLVTGLGQEVSHLGIRVNFF